MLFFFNEVARQFKIIHVPGILFLECQDGTGIENSGIFGELVFKANDTEDIYKTTKLGAHFTVTKLNWEQ